jgi:ABC-type branched-subunit amino acid transport system ATPase component
MLTGLTIKRFRGIPTLVLEDFGTVNIFVGENGSGKTSVLEAIFLLASPTDPRMAANLGPWREQPAATIADDDALSSVFHRGDLRHGPEFEFTASGERQILRISHLIDQGPTQVVVNPSELTSEGTEAPDSVRGLVYEFQPTPGVTPVASLISDLRLTPNGPVQATIRKYYDKSLGCFYVHARRATSAHETAAVLTALSKNHNTQEFLTAMRTFDDRVSAIEAGVRFGGRPTVQVDLELPTKLPLQVMGDGFCRSVLMVTGLFYAKPKILAVDEIDSGLHASVMGRFWKSLSGLATKYEKQIFCTTHDEEMLSRTIDAFKESPDSLRIYRIDRLKDGRLLATKYTHESYCKSDHLGLDIR